MYQSETKQNAWSPLLNTHDNEEGWNSRNHEPKLMFLFTAKKFPKYSTVCVNSGTFGRCGICTLRIDSAPHYGEVYVQSNRCTWTLQVPLQERKRYAFSSSPLNDEYNEGVHWITQSSLNIEVSKQTSTSFLRVVNFLVFRGTTL